MKYRTLLLLIALAALAVFAALNWSVIMSPTPLSLGFAVVQAPLGLIMLGVLVCLTALFLMYVVTLQASVVLEARRHAREIHANRALADKGEASRFTELRAFLAEELNRMASQDTEARAAVLARLDQLDRDLRAALEQSATTLSAYIGELEDRLDRGAYAPASPPNS